MDNLDLSSIIENYAKEHNLSIYDVASISAKLLGDMATTTKELHGALAIVNTNTKRHADIEQDHLPRFSHTMLYDTFVYQLSSKEESDVIFKYVQETHGKDDEWMKKAKHEKISDKVVSGVVNRLYKANQNIITPIDEKGIQVKDIIYTRTTPNAQVNNLAVLILMSDAIDELRHTTTELRIENILNTSRLDNIEQYLSIDGGKLNAKKIAAIKLKSEGYTYKKISEILGVSDRTIKNWIKISNKDNNTNYNTEKLVN